ncbi:hypothetical protein BRADI_2g21439v3 [Brachypodium distachyon]|uniref:Association with the SNF1 complex (ASC) domain-containing protein n=1 Tax=Brachypodium distachyon TaxID=15368 RepID=A0A2K2D9R3_BRADI|nr:hypothetical protein BRADI_2g21439v3 [Brachypodium distachyon]
MLSAKTEVSGKERIIVEGQPRYVPELPHVTDERGQVANLLDVQDYVPGSLDSMAEFDAPPTPEHSYDLYTSSSTICSSIEKGWGSQSLLALGVTHRIQSKYVNFVLYKPLLRR